MKNEKKIFLRINKLEFKRFHDENETTSGSHVILIQLSVEKFQKPGPFCVNGLIQTNNLILLNRMSRRFLIDFFDGCIRNARNCVIAGYNCTLSIWLKERKKSAVYSKQVHWKK